MRNQVRAWLAISVLTLSIGYALPAVVIAPAAGLVASAQTAEPTEVTPAPGPAVELPPFELPLPVGELLGWAFSSSVVVQLLRRGAAALDPQLGKGVGAAVIMLLISIGAVAYGAATGAFGGAPVGIEGWVGRVALLVLAAAVSYKLYIGKLIPDPEAPPEPA